MKHKAVIIPVPYEKTTSWGKGAKNGPDAIISAFNYVEAYDIEENKVIDTPSINILPALKNINTYQKLSEKISKITDKVLNDRKIPVYLGGEHTITAAIIRTIKARRLDFSVLHMDAHLDMKDTYDGTKYSHACVMRRVYEMGVPIVSVGIRSLCSAEQQFAKRKGLNIFYSHQISNNKDWMTKAIKRLGNNFYLSFDVDVMDPSCVRSTGTPEPGGLGWYQAVDFLKAVANSGKRLIGMDMLELAPSRDDRASEFLCAKLIYKILTLFVR